MTVENMVLRTPVQAEIHCQKLLYVLVELDRKWKKKEGIY